MVSTAGEDPGLFPGLVIALVLAFVGCLLLRNTRGHRGTFQWQTRLFLIAFAVRFGVSIVVYVFGLVNIIKDEDAGGWIAGKLFADQWARQGVTFVDLPAALLGVFDGQHLGYKYMLALFFYLTGSPYRLVAGALNAFFGALTAVLAYRIARSLYSEWVAVRAGW